MTLQQQLGATEEVKGSARLDRVDSNLTGGWTGNVDSRSRTNSMITGGTTKAIETLNLDPKHLNKDDFDDVIEFNS